jgi:ferredoxin
MTHIITSLCLRDGGCVEVCPVECIVPGYPKGEFPWYYIDPDTCIDCGACIPECPYEAIFPEDDIPGAYSAKGGEFISRIGLSGHYEGTNHHGIHVVLDCVRQLEKGEEVDLTEDIQSNYEYFKTGTGYAAWDNVDRDGTSK